MKKKLFLSLVAFAALALSACTPAANSNNNNNTDDITQTSGDNSGSGDSSNTGTGDNQGSGSGNSGNTGSNTGDNTGTVDNTGGQDENQNVVKAILASGEQTLSPGIAEPDKYIVEQYTGILTVSSGEEVSFTLNGVALPMYLSGDDTANNKCNNTTESPSDIMLSTYHVHTGGSVQVYVKHNKGTNEQGVDFDNWAVWIDGGPSERNSGGNPGQEVDTTSIYIRGDAANGWEVGDLSEDYKFKPSEDANNQGELKGVTLKVGSFKVAKTNWDDYELGWSYKNDDESDDHLVVQSNSIANKSEYFEAGENGNIKVLKEGTFDIYLTVNNYLYIELVNGGSTEPVNPNPGEQEPAITAELGWYLVGNDAFLNNEEKQAWKIDDGVLAEAEATDNNRAEFLGVEVAENSELQIVNVRLDDNEKKVADWYNLLGAEYEFASRIDADPAEDVEDFHIKFTAAGTYNFYVNSEGNIYIAEAGSGEQEPEIPEEVIVDSLSLEVTHHHDWENMYVYLFKGQGESLVENAKWPGEKLTDGKDNGSGSLNYTVDLSGYSKVIFNNGVEGDGAAQTEDIVINDLVGKAGIYWDDNVLKSWSNPVATSEVWVKAGENAAIEVTELSFDMSGEKVQHVLENVPLTSKDELSVARNEAFDSYDHIVLADDDEGLTASLVDAVETLVPTIKVKEDGKYNFYFIEQGDADNTIKVYVSKIQELSDIYSLHYGLSGAETWTTVADEKVSIVETEDENVKGQLKFADVVSDGTTAFKVFGPNDSTFGSKHLEVNPTEEDNDIVLPSGTFDIYFKLMKEGNPLIYISRHDVNLQYNIDLGDFASYGEDKTGVVYAYSWGAGLEAKAVQITGNTFELREGIEGFKIVLLAEAAKDDIFTDEVWASVIEGKDSGNLTVKGDRETAILKYVDGKFNWTYEGAPVSGYALKVTSDEAQTFIVPTDVQENVNNFFNATSLKAGDIVGAYDATNGVSWNLNKLSEGVSESLFKVVDGKIICQKDGDYHFVLTLDSNGDTLDVAQAIDTTFRLTYGGAKVAKIALASESWKPSDMIETSENSGVYEYTAKVSTLAAKFKFVLLDTDTNTMNWDLLNSSNRTAVPGETYQYEYVVPTSQTIKVYFESPATVYLYAWSGEGDNVAENAAWPGVDVTTGTKVDNNYVLDLGTYENIILSSTVNNTTKQTADLKVADIVNAGGITFKYSSEGWAGYELWGGSWVSL